MRPSPEIIALIRAEVTNWGPDDATIAASLNAPDRPNPVPQTTVPKPFTVAQVFGAASLASLANLKNVAFLPDVRDKIQANDVPACNLYANLLLVGGVVSQADHDAILAVVNATEPDPSWPAQISWAQATLLRPATPDDVAASRPGAE